MEFPEVKALCAELVATEHPPTHAINSRLNPAPPVAHRRQSFRQHRPSFSAALQLTDAVLLVAATVLAGHLHAFPDARTERLETLTGLVGGAVCAYCLGISQAYTTHAVRSAAAELRICVATLALGVAAIFFQLFYLRVPEMEEWNWPLAWMVPATLLLAASRCTLRALMARLTRSGYLCRHIAVVGANSIGDGFILRATAAGTGDRIVGLYDDALLTETASGEKVLGDVDELIQRSHRERIDSIVIAELPQNVERVAELRRRLKVTIADIYLSVGSLGLRPGRGCVVDLAAEPVILMEGSPIRGWDALRKRVFDVAIAASALVLIAPLMALVALIIRLDSPGPVLFRQPRLGFNNTLFSVYKFRTMYHHMADLHADRQTRRNDERVTRVGKFLRRLSIDELPQLLNVLKGDMSLVGPRPHALNTKVSGRLFKDTVDEYALRHRVKPGITGWAQVNGWRGETRTVEHLEKRVACDLHYIENWSLLFDLKILGLTLLKGMSGVQAY